jgi:hypothetical protein
MATGIQVGTNASCRVPDQPAKSTARGFRDLL